MIKIIPVDMDDAGNSAAEADAVKAALKSNSLFNQNCLYTVIDGKRLEEFLQRGTYREGDSIDAFTKKHLNSDNPADFDLSTMLKEYYPPGKPAIAVYKIGYFEKKFEFTYIFKDPENKPEALKAILDINW